MGMNMWGCQASVYTPNHITDPYITDKSFYPIYHAGHDPFHYVGEKKTQQTAPEGPVQYIKLIWVIQVEWQQRIKGFGGVLKERTVKIQVIQVVIHVFPLTMIFFIINVFNVHC